jgi:hypothetical protein
MTRGSLARRFAPLVAVIAVQLLIIALAPSRAPEQVAAGAEGSGFVDPLDGGSAAGDEGALDGGLVAGDEGATGAVGAGGTRTSGGASGGGAAAGGSAGAAGDTSHCVGDRQSDPAIYPWAPPCQAKFKGDSGGDTYPGIEKGVIKVVVMRGNYGAAVDAALTAAGSNPAPADFDAALRTAEKYVNANYELYGRKVVFKQRKFRCGTGGEGPPDDQCLRNEARQIIAEEKPFAVIWSNSVSSATYDEFSNLKVLNIGGYGFRDGFNADNAPYHWDVQMGGTQLANQVASWWCGRMHGQKAAFAGRHNPPTNDIRQKTRVLGVISTDDPENQSTVDELNGALQRGCGAQVGDHRYFYSQNVQTAPTQRRAAIARMREGNESTSVMCFCDQVAPAFLYDEMELNNYYPENIIVATGFMDTDTVSHTYDHLFDPARPENEYPTFENAFGLAQVGQQESKDTDYAARIWKWAGSPGRPAWDAAGDYDYWNFFGTLVMQAGPNLTPANIMEGAKRSKPIVPLGGTDPRFGPRSVAAGDFTWDDGLREIFWAPLRKSAYDGVSGAWGSLNGGRWFTGGRFPAGAIQLPGQAPRS